LFSFILYFKQTNAQYFLFRELQVNLIRSHSSGIGDYMSTKHVRMLMALRINVLAKGYSGISTESLESVINAFNKSCLPLVPEQGTVGASGDLAPLSHIVLGLLGEGKMWSPSTGLEDSAIVLQKHGLKPIQLKPKEGLALINGTQMITALGAEAIERAKYLALQADIISALTVEVLKGNVSQFDDDIHKARPHKGQMDVAARLRALLHSDVFDSKCFLANKADRKVQDPYTLRCIPQVHGVVIDTINFAKELISTEMNSATDNPMVMSHRNELISGGNFHGEYPAKALDYLAIGVHELANISERRIERLVNCAYSEGLPSFLVQEGGINSGFMIAHCTAAALTSENKVLCHPSSSDTISTSGGTEDHVSMGGWSARKAIKVINNVENILAIELLAGCQALDFFHANGYSSTQPLEAVYSVVRKYIKPWKKDRYMSPGKNHIKKENNKITNLNYDYS
jgi:histidine ammonia-lyase